MQRNYEEYLSPARVASSLGLVRESLFPDGRFEYTEDRSPAVVERTARTLHEELPRAIPSSIRLVLGRENVTRACSDVHEFFQCRQLTKSLGFAILDMLFLKLFPDFAQTEFEELGIAHMKIPDAADSSRTNDAPTLPVLSHARRAAGNHHRVGNDNQ